MDTKKMQQQMLQYIEESGDQVIVYSNIGNQWVKQSLSQYNPLTEYENYIKAITSVTPISEDARFIVYEVIASGSYLKESLERSLASTGMSRIKLPPDLLNDVNDFKYTITVDKKTMAISQMNMDLSDIMSKITAKMVATQNIPDDQKQIMQEMFSTMKIAMQVKFSQFNRIKKITIPAEVKKSAQSHIVQPKPLKSQ